MSPTTSTSGRPTTARLEVDGKYVDLPVIDGHGGRGRHRHREAARADRARSRSTRASATRARASSAITFIDGEKGILRYRGYPIEELAEKSTFLEVAWLLHRRRAADARRARRVLARRARITRCCTRTSAASSRRCRRTRTRCRCAPRRSGALATFYQEPETEQSLQRHGHAPPREDADDRGVFVQALDRPAVHVPEATTSTTATNFLHMMFATPCEEYVVDPVLAKALDLLLILHADHEQNCSTSTVRVVGSSQREPVREHLGRHQRAVGPAARRREPASDRDARAHRGARAATRRSSWTARRTRTTRRG